MEVDAMNQTVYSECDVEHDMELDISLHVYFAGSLYVLIQFDYNPFTGYTISLVALLTTLAIFLSFRWVE